MYIFLDMVMWFVRLGIKTIAIPMLEMNRNKKNHRKQMRQAKEPDMIWIISERGNDDKKTRTYIQKKINELSHSFGLKFLLLSTSPNSKMDAQFFSSKSWLFANKKSHLPRAMLQKEKLGRLIKKARRKSMNFFKTKYMDEYLR